MAKNYQLEQAGSCFIIKRKSPHVKHGVPIGRVCQEADGWRYGYVGAGSPKPIYGPKKTKAAAIKAAVRAYKSWIG